MAEATPALFDLPGEPTPRRWADIRPGDRVGWPPGGPWTVRRIARSPHTRTALHVDLVADDGTRRTIAPDERAAEPEPTEVPDG